MLLGIVDSSMFRCYCFPHFQFCFPRAESYFRANQSRADRDLNSGAFENSHISRRRSPSVALIIKQRVLEIIHELLLEPDELMNVKSQFIFSIGVAATKNSKMLSVSFPTEIINNGLMS